MIHIAIDIGGTQIKAALIDQHYHMFEYQKWDTPDNQQRHITDVVSEIVAAYQAQHPGQIKHVGISTAGIVDETLGMITYAGPTIPNYQGTNFKTLLAPYNMEVHVYNDVNAALLGERACHDYSEDSLFCLTLGTGIGGAFYSKDTGIYKGHHFRANDIGYLLYRPDTDTNYEQRASTSALKQRLAAVTTHNVGNVAVFFQQAEDGASDIQRVLHDWGDHVAEGIAQIQIIYDPERIIIGGGVSAQQSRLLQYILPYIPKYLPEGYAHAPVTIAQSHNHAALFGAVSGFIEK